MIFHVLFEIRYKLRATKVALFGLYNDAIINQYGFNFRLCRSYNSKERNFPSISMLTIHHPLERKKGHKSDADVCVGRNCVPTTTHCERWRNTTLRGTRLQLSNISMVQSRVKIGQCASGWGTLGSWWNALNQLFPSFLSQIGDSRLPSYWARAFTSNMHRRNNNIDRTMCTCVHRLSWNARISRGNEKNSKGPFQFNILLILSIAIIPHFPRVLFVLSFFPPVCARTTLKGVVSFSLYTTNISWCALNISSFFLISRIRIERYIGGNPCNFCALLQIANSRRYPKAMDRQCRGASSRNRDSSDVLIDRVHVALEAGIHGIQPGSFYRIHIWREHNSSAFNSHFLIRQHQYPARVNNNLKNPGRINVALADCRQRPPLLRARNLCLCGGLLRRAIGRIALSLTSRRPLGSANNPIWLCAHLNFCFRVSRAIKCRYRYRRWNTGFVASTVSPLSDEHTPRGRYNCDYFGNPCRDNRADLPQQGCARA